MLTEKTIQQLKQNNISVDAEKSRGRTAEVWNAASKDDQEAILTLAGVKRGTVQRAYRTGSISAKLVVPIAQTLNVNPYYLTGEADDKGGAVDTLIQQLLTAHKYDALLDQAAKDAKKAKRKASRKTKEAQAPTEPPAKETEEETAQRFDQDVKSTLKKETERLGAEKAVKKAVSPAAVPDISPEQKKAIDGLTEEDMVTLMRAILLKEKAGEKNAELALQLKLLLLS